MGKVIGFSVPQKIIGKTYGDSCSPDIFIGNQFSVWGKAKGYSLCSVGSKRMLCSIEVAVYRVTIQSNVILVEGAKRPNIVISKRWMDHLLSQGP